MKSVISVLLMLMLPGLASALPLGGRSSRGLKEGSSMYGLCSQDLVNVDSAWTKGQPNASYCQDIDETLDNQMGCNLKLKRPGKHKLDETKTIADQLRENPAFIRSLHEACGDKIEKIKNDPVKFKLFLKQLMAVLFIQENEWKTEPTSYMGAQGLGQLDAASVRAYGRCNQACADIGKTRITKGGPNHVGDHNNVKCAVTISLFYMGIDDTMGYGRGNNGSYGIARYFQPFRKINTKDREEWMMPKLKKYCNERIDQESDSSSTPTPQKTQENGTSAG